MRRLQRDVPAAVSILAGLIWSWLDTRTYLGPESPAAARWRIAALALMLATACWVWYRGQGNHKMD